MDLLSLILYGAINVAMVLYHVQGKGRFIQFPFWAGIIALGWFFPHAIGGYFNAAIFPENAYTDSMLFAGLCTAALWFGFSSALARIPSRPSWLDADFDVRKLYFAGAVLCTIGFFFQWKLWSLPEEYLERAIWTGATVKYSFFANLFKLGFITLWLLYLREHRVLVSRFIVFIVPSLLLLLEAAVLRGRRAAMMELASYLVVSLWFVRRIAVPRWFILSGLVFGLIIVNAIGIYRTIMTNKDADLSTRFSQAAQAKYTDSMMNKVAEAGEELKNYVYYRQVYIDLGCYDFGASHWNKFIFNYVPAQIFGRDFKESLMIDPETSISLLAEEMYGHHWKPGTTSTGYKDAFGSFGWLGFIKFMWIGYLMGVLYRHAMHGTFLGQLLYIYSLTVAMHAISHQTNGILVRIWIYFFALAYPVLYLAKHRHKHPLDGEAAPTSVPG